jgi:hypothetical protein
MACVIVRVRNVEHGLRAGWTLFGMALTAVLIAGCTAGSSVTPSPTESPAPTASPTAEEPSAAESEPAGDFPTAEEEELLNHISDSVIASCIRSEFGAGVGVAAIECGITAAGGDITLTYHLFESTSDMSDAYDANLAFMGVERDSGACDESWPGESAYTFGLDSGRVACVDFGSVHIISWTDDGLLIKGYAEGFGVDQQQFYEWWTTDDGLF